MCFHLDTKLISFLASNQFRHLTMFEGENPSVL
jgi:hypothetical protein